MKPIKTVSGLLFAKRGQHFPKKVALLCAFLALSGGKVYAGSWVETWGLPIFHSLTPPAHIQGHVVAIASGTTHTLALTEAGAVVIWGHDCCGQLNVPEAAKANVVAMAGGQFHVLALKADGSVVAWGLNDFGQTDVPAAAQSGVIAIDAGEHHSVALKQDGSVMVWGRGTEGQKQIPAGAMSGVKAIAAAGFRVLALKEDGAVLAWGRDWFGPATATIPPDLKDVTAIAAGFNNNMALKADGSVVVWSFNPIPVPEGARSGVKAISASYDHMLALRMDGTVVGWGVNSSGGAGELPPPPVGLSGVIAISSGGAHNVALYNPTAPAVTTGPADQTVEAGGLATFTVASTGYPVSYQWLRKGVDIPGATGRTVHVRATSEDDGAEYSVRISNLLDSVTSAPAKLDVYVNPPVITRQPQSVVIEPGRWEALSVETSGTLLTYQWQKNGQDIPGEVYGSYYKQWMPEDDGIYTVKVRNEVGSVVSSPANVSVKSRAIFEPYTFNSLSLGVAPRGIAVDKSGNLFVADSLHNRIIKMSSSGLVETVAGPDSLQPDGTAFTGANDGVGTEARFSFALEGPGGGLAVDAQGNLYLADTYNSTIRKITAEGVVTTLAGNAAAAHNWQEPRFAEGTGSEARFDWPLNVAVDSSGNVFVADAFNGRIRKITPLGAVTTIAMDIAVRSVAVDREGNVFATADGVVVKVDKEGIVTTVAGKQDEFGTADGSASDARFSIGFEWYVSPGAIVVDDNGVIYLADSYACSIRKITPEGQVTTLGGEGIFIPYYPHSEGGDCSCGNRVCVCPINVRGGFIDGTGRNARFAVPVGIAIDPSGKLFISDRWNGAVRIGIPASRALSLSVNTATGRALLSWEASTEEMILESTSDLGSANGWTRVASALEVVGSRNTTSEPLADSVKFYRLIRR